MMVKDTEFFLNKAKKRFIKVHEKHPDDGPDRVYNWSWVKNNALTYACEVIEKMEKEKEEEK